MNLFRKIFPLFCLIISFLLSFVVFYKSQIYWEGNIINNFYQNYYIFCIIFVIYSIILFFINNNIKDYFIIFTFTFVFSLYLFETYLSFTKYSANTISKKKLELYKKVTKKNYDTRSKIDVFNDLKKSTTNVAVTVYPFTNINKKNNFFPLSGVSNSKTIYCNENGYYSVYQSDRYGFNNPDNEWNHNEIEYLLVGDSFTHGACVNRPHDIGSVLRTLSNKPVLNLGYAGNGPLIEYATLREYIRPNVNKVIFVYFEENDLYNLSNELDDEILSSYLKDSTFSQNLKFKQHDIDQSAQKQINQILLAKSDVNIKIKIEKFLKLRNLRNYFKGTSIPKPRPQPEFKKILEQAKNLTSKNNSKFYFVYLPEINKIKSNYVGDTYHEVKEIVESLGISFIDIQKEIFINEKDPFNFIPFLHESGVHYNIDGYKKVAETIHNFDK